jgi:putative transposase
MLKAIHAQEDKGAALEKATAVVQKLSGMQLTKAALKLEKVLTETLIFHQSIGHGFGRIIRLRD